MFFNDESGVEEIVVGEFFDFEVVVGVMGRFLGDRERREE